MPLTVADQLQQLYSQLFNVPEERRTPNVDQAAYAIVPPWPKTERSVFRTIAACPDVIVRTTWSFTTVRVSRCRNVRATSAECCSLPGSYTIATVNGGTCPCFGGLWIVFYYQLSFLSIGSAWLYGRSNIRRNFLSTNKSQRHKTLVCLKVTHKNISGKSDTQLCTIDIFLQE